MSALKADYLTVFQSDAGRRILAELMETFHVVRPVHGTGNSHETSFRDGQRYVVLYVLSRLGPEEREPARKPPTLTDQFVEDAIREFAETGAAP